MKKYEYNAINNPTSLGDRLLNKLGEEGWELVSHAYDTITFCHFYTFKREKAEEQAEYRPSRTNHEGPK